MHLTQQAVHYNHSLVNHHNLLSTTSSQRDWCIIDDAVSKFLNHQATDAKFPYKLETADSELYGGLCRTPEQMNQNCSKNLTHANGKMIENDRFEPSGINMNKLIKKNGMLTSLLTELDYNADAKTEANSFSDCVKSKQHLLSTASYSNNCTPDTENNDKPYAGALRLSEFLHTPVTHNIPASLSPHSVTKTVNYGNNNRRSKQFQRTKICPYYIKGYCANQDQCSYAHHLEELQPLPDLRKTKLCCSIKRGKNCYVQNCTYAHSIQELKPPPDLDTYKTSFCFFWKKSKCFNGSKCRFAHGEHELRVKKNDATASGANAVAGEPTGNFASGKPAKYMPLNSLKNTKDPLCLMQQQHSTEKSTTKCDLAMAQNLASLCSYLPQHNDKNFSYDSAEGLTMLKALPDFDTGTTQHSKVMVDEPNELPECDSKQRRLSEKDKDWIHFQQEKLYMNDKNSKNDESLNCLVENILSNLNQLVIQSNN